MWWTHTLLSTPCTQNFCTAAPMPPITSSSENIKKEIFSKCKWSFLCNLETLKIRVTYVCSTHYCTWEISWSKGIGETFPEWSDVCSSELIFSLMVMDNSSVIFSDALSPVASFFFFFLFLPFFWNARSYKKIELCMKQLRSIRITYLRNYISTYCTCAHIKLINGLTFVRSLQNNYNCPCLTLVCCRMFFLEIGWPLKNSWSLLIRDYKLCSCQA